MSRIRGTPAQLERLIHTAFRSTAHAPVTQFRVFEHGYEDCNIHVLTDTGDFVMKVFATSRDETFPHRYVSVVAAARAAGVLHPPVVPDLSGAVVHHDSATMNRYVILERASGSPIAHLFHTPPRAVLENVVHQAIALHSIDEVVVVDDSDIWCPARLDRTLGLVRKHLSGDLEILIRPAVEAWERLDPRLPTCPIHTDLSQTNVLITPRGGVEILDLASVGRYPRIQELAFIAVNLMHGDPRDLFERVQLVSDLYEAHSPLVPEEAAALMDYTLVTAAMEILGALYYRHLRGMQTDENELVLKIGVAGLRSVLPTEGASCGT